MEQFEHGRDKTAIYAKVAYDIASRVAGGDLVENARFSGRSLMGTEYHVSQETIRRAMKLLADMGIIEIRQNSGARVISREQALAYLEKYKMAQDMQTLKQELRAIMERRAALDARTEQLVSDLLDLNDRFEKSNPLRNYEFHVAEGSPLLGKSIREADFRRITGALIVAVKREGSILLSPDPDLRFTAGDIIVTAGNPFSVAQVEALIKGI
ncbi:MAG: GntR family transcriptional regulator [Christensenellaceae bacterium]|jgi:K+/H+ antiporter YhaU regulatory subunit KhtT|nr:GntR family transcriptional regulator [Christensenellaceae bacterium]